MHFNIVSAMRFFCAFHEDLSSILPYAGDYLLDSYGDAPSAKLTRLARDTYCHCNHRKSIVVNAVRLRFVQRRHSRVHGNYAGVFA